MVKGDVVSSDWYEGNAQAYIDGTMKADVSHVRQRFLVHVRNGGRILDAGCGPGRDALEFQLLGFDVTAFDASAAMARFAGELIGKPVLQMRHQDVEFQSEFDAVWSMASLLHVPQSELQDVFARYRRALYPGGVLFASFKHGAGEAVVGHRLFTYQSRESIAELIDSIDGLNIIDVWTDFDTRPGLSSQEWLSVICGRE